MNKRHKNPILSRPTVRIAYPVEGEVIAGNSYAFQIVAAGAGAEVSIDQGAWMPCREALGLWWYDWRGFEKGAHELTARTRMGDGLTVNSTPRRFFAE